MKTPAFSQSSCWECPSLQQARSSYESSYCTGFPGKKQKRFSKVGPKRKIPDWCPKRISPPACRIYGFINDEEAIMEFMLNHGSSTFEQGIAFPSERRYKLRGSYPLAMTAKELYETMQLKPISSIFPDEEFAFGELIEIDDGIKSHCFYYAAEKGFVYAPVFQTSKIPQNKAGGGLNGKK